MSYAVRNTIVLLIVLLLIYGGGFGYMHFIQKPEIERLASEAEEKQREYSQMIDIAELVPMLTEQVEAARDFIESFDKTIFRTSNPDEVYRFLSIVNAISDVHFNYTFIDSTTSNEYGTLQSEITGIGLYRDVNAFINGIEFSEPVQKINNVVISPVNEPGEFNLVNFSFNLVSNYDRTSGIPSQRTPGVSAGDKQFAHNPFFPLIRAVDPNVDNLPDVDSSRLIGVGSSRIYLRNQDGRMITLQPNDRVYLGRLESIDVINGRAVFRLNRGGIIDMVTLEVQR